jgi:DNA-binding XRE family transcriptional regulator
MDAMRFTATENLFSTLERRERTRAWLARKIGVSTSLMYFLSRGSRTLSLDKAMRAAAVLDEPLEWLFVATSVLDQDAEMETAA